jgi:DNA-binding MarR family transcriptional regulator
LGIDELQGPSLGDLAAHMGLDKSTLSRTVDSLVGGGLVAREPGLKDRRKMRITLTENGSSICERIHADNDAFYVAVLNDAEVEADVIMKVFEGFTRAMSTRMKTDGPSVKCASQKIISNCP